MQRLGWHRHSGRRFSVHGIASRIRPLPDPREPPCFEMARRVRADVGRLPTWRCLAFQFRCLGWLLS